MHPDKTLFRSFFVPPRSSKSLRSQLLSTCRMRALEANPLLPPAAAAAVAEASPSYCCGFSNPPILKNTMSSSPSSASRKPQTAPWSSGSSAPLSATACSCSTPRSPSDVACLARGQIVKLLAPHIKKCVRALARHNAQPGTVLPMAPLAEFQCLQHCMRILCCFFEGLRESKEGNVHAFFELGEIPLSRSQCESFSLI